ncbi:MAG: copper resistance protein NlpE [Methylomarinum sp.]|nr:copper resistance protein NlpE [Methylomarinum sp.]
MKALTIPLKQKLNVILLSVLTIAFNPAEAKSDKQYMADVQRARELLRKKGDHSQHNKPVDESQKFRGVYYGYLPCKECAGIKTTLSLKNKKNYLIVTQYAQASNKEFYEKGKYDWDDKTRILTLTARKDSSIREYSIINEATIIPFVSKGKPRRDDLDAYTLLRSDASKSREIHIH